jgi:hypothetical protein
MLNNYGSNSAVVSIENIDNGNDNFILKSPPRGKLYRGPNWNAFNRQSLGTIPRKSENILFQEKNSDTKKGFMSQVVRFEEYNKLDSVKFAYPGPGKYSINENMDKTIISNPSISTKGYGTGFTSAFDRFDDPREYYEKYYPGPCEYKNNKNAIQSNEKSNLKYKSLYYTNDSKSLKISKDIPGPGNYNPSIPSNLNKESEMKENYFFASKDKRFKNQLKTKDAYPLIGPGRYFNYTEFTAKDPDKTSFFFKNNIVKPDDPIERHLKISKVQKYKVPGPGEYNLRQELIDQSKFNYNMPRKPLIDEDEKNIEKYIENEIEHINLARNASILPPENVIVKNDLKGSRSVFVSKSPKTIEYNKYHNPGPSYYHPQIWPKKISYNCNSEKTWI